jgi:hypothetical protein
VGGYTISGFALAPEKIISTASRRRPIGSNEPIPLAENHRLFLNPQDAARKWCNRTLFDPCKSVLISVICGEVLDFFLKNNPYCRMQINGPKRALIN